MKNARASDVFIPPEKDKTSDAVGGRFMVKAMNSYVESQLYEAQVAERKTALLSIIPDGATVLEVGIGIGPNLRYIPRNVQVIGVEPNIYMWSTCRKRAEELGIELTLYQAFAEKLPLPSASVDVVIFTHVLCSVEEQTAALCEAARVLRPGGLLLFLEHVLALEDQHLNRAFQRLMNPFLRHFMGNCHSTCETGENIRDMADKTELFDSVNFERFSTNMGWFLGKFGIDKPNIIGSASRTDTPFVHHLGTVLRTSI